MPLETLSKPLRVMAVTWAESVRCGAGSQLRDAEALKSDEAEIRATSRHNLARLAGKDLGDDPAAWQRWLAEQERAARD